MSNVGGARFTFSDLKQLHFLSSLCFAGSLNRPRLWCHMIGREKQLSIDMTKNSRDVLQYDALATIMRV